MSVPDTIHNSLDESGSGSGDSDYNTIILHNLSDPEWLQDLYFLTDLTEVLSDLNRQQRCCGSLDKCIEYLTTFKNTLLAIKYHLSCNNYVLFRRTNAHFGSTLSRNAFHSTVIDSLSDFYEPKFNEIPTLEFMSYLLQKPWSITCKLIPPEFKPIEHELEEFNQNNTELLSLQEWFNRKPYDLSIKYPTLAQTCCDINTVIGTSFYCESDFISIAINRTKFKGTHTSAHLCSLLSLRLTPQRPDPKEVAKWIVNGQIK